jgi:hypothetical protein
MARKEDFETSVPLPPGLSLVAIRKAVDYLERQLADLVEIYYEQANVGKPVIIWRVDVVFLESTDWKYEKSSAGELGGGRTHTFGVKNPAMKLKGRAAYARKDVRIKDSKPVPINGNGD